MSKLKVKRFKNENLRNEESFQFYTVFIDLFEDGSPKEDNPDADGTSGVPFSPSALGIEELFAPFLVLYDKADEALELIRKSATTEKIAEADTTRDLVLRGFTEAVHSAVNHFDDAKRDAARRLQVVLGHYGNLAIKSYDEETAAIYNLLQELTGANAADVSLLGLTDWVVQLEADNKAFSALMEARYAENAGKTELRMKNVRKELDRCYRDIIDFIDAKALVNGEATYAPFVKELNTRVERFAAILAQRKGRNGKKKDSED
jgi:hypothetical protein